MTYSVPTRLIRLLQKHLINNYLPPRMRHQERPGFTSKDLQFFAHEAGALSNAFTVRRSSLPKNYLNLVPFRAGYILYFTATNYLKALFCLTEAGIEKTPAGGEELSVLDIGSGPGTALLAAVDFFRENLSLVQMVGIDQNKHILKDAQNLVKSYSDTKARFIPICSGVSPKNLSAVLRGRRYNIVFLSNILSEMHSHREQMEIVSTIIRHVLTKNGRLIIIEPALQRTTRDLMGLRDAILEDCPGLEVISPCIDKKPCPMLRLNNRDWCHMYLDWTRPDFIEKIDRLIGNKKDYLKFSYLILENCLGRKPKGQDIYRVVSSPLFSKGKAELLLCRNGNIRRLTLLEKDKSKSNEFLLKLQRGDLVRYSGPDKLAFSTKIDTFS